MSNERIERGFHEGETLWAVHCDTCGRRAPTTHYDPGKAAEGARRAGYTTKSRGLGEPKAWICPSCLKN